MLKLDNNQNEGQWSTGDPFWPQFFWAGKCCVSFWGGFISVNGNHSPHGVFKDLDLSRTFHYSECRVEKCLSRSWVLSPMGCTQQDFRMRAQCGVIYTCWYRSAVLPVILSVLLSTFLYVRIPWSPKARPFSCPTISLSCPISVPSLFIILCALLAVLPFALSKLA